MMVFSLAPKPAPPVLAVEANGDFVVQDYGDYIIIWSNAELGFNYPPNV